MAACTGGIYRYDSSGNLLQTYTPTFGTGDDFEMSLDPDGTSFWVVGISSATVNRISISNGSILASWQGYPSGSSGEATGIFAIQTSGLVGGPLAPGDRGCRAPRL